METRTEVVNQYARDLLAEAGWKEDNLLELWARKHITILADANGDILERIKQSGRVLLAIPTLLTDHEVNQVKERLMREAGEREKNTRHPLELGGITPEMAKNRWGELWESRR